MHVGHSWLVHAAIPSDVAWAAVSVAVHVLVVLMEHRVLASTPLAVCIRNWRILGKNTGEIPVEQVGVVHQGLGMKSVVVHHDGSVAPETSSATTEDEICDPTVGEANTNVEAFNWEFTNGEETKKASDLSTRGVIGPVEIGPVNWSGNFLHLAAGEPTSENVQIVLSFLSPLRKVLLKNVFTHTETDQIVVLHILSSLRVD